MSSFGIFFQGGGGETACCLGFLVFIVIVIVFAVKAHNEQQERQKREAAERLRRIRETTEKLQDHLNRGLLPLYQGTLPLVLKQNEYPLACAPATLSEERAVRIYKGTTLRGKYVSSTSGVSRSYGELQTIDSGQLVLTNKRLVFVGALRTSTTDLSKLVNVELFSDAIRVHRQGKQKAEIYNTENPTAYKIMVEVLAKTSIKGATEDALLLENVVNLNLNQSRRIILEDAGSSKINVIKVVREVTGLGLKEAKDLVESAPTTVTEGVSQQEAEMIRQKLEEVGARIIVM